MISDDFSREEEKQGGPHRGFCNFIGEGRSFTSTVFRSHKKMLLLEGTIVNYIGRLRET